MKNRIKDMILGLGSDVCGVAHIDRFMQAPKGFHPTDIYPDCKSVIVFGIALPKGATRAKSSLIYSHYNDCCIQRVDELTFQAAKRIEEEFGGVAVPLPCDGPYDYWDNEKLEGRGLLSMRHAAVLAGLGTLGKSTLLLNEKYGNRLTIGAILSELELASDEPSRNICIEGCTLCLDNCPSQALDGVKADQSKCRPGTYGKNARGFSTVNCNKCRTRCPMSDGKDD